MGRLAGKVALVTGSTSGVGEATVRRFASEGAQFVFVGMSKTRGELIVSQLHNSANFVQADVSIEEGLKHSIDVTYATYGRLDILFSSAGVPAAGTIETLTPDDFTKAMDLLLGSVLFGIKHAAPIMRAKRWGRIIDTTSVAGLRAHMGDHLYQYGQGGDCACHAVGGGGTGRFGITVNSIAPGAVTTPIFFDGSTVVNELDPVHAAAKLAKLTANLAKATPRLAPGFPQDVAAAALFLASNDAGHLNGHGLVVDGGMIAGGRVNYE